MENKKQRSKLSWRYFPDWASGVHKDRIFLMMSLGLCWKAAGFVSVVFLTLLSSSSHKVSQTKLVCPVSEMGNLFFCWWTPIPNSLEYTLSILLELWVYSGWLDHFWLLLSLFEFSPLKVQSFLLGIPQFSLFRLITVNDYFPMYMICSFLVKNCLFFHQWQNCSLIADKCEV